MYTYIIHVCTYIHVHTYIHIICMYVWMYVCVHIHPGNVCVVCAHIHSLTHVNCDVWYTAVCTTRIAGGYPQFFLPSSKPAVALNSKVCKQLSAHVWLHILSLFNFSFRPSWPMRVSLPYKATPCITWSTTSLQYWLQSDDAGSERTNTIRHP